MLQIPPSVNHGAQVKILANPMLLDNKINTPKDIYPYGLGSLGLQPSQCAKT